MHIDDEIIKKLSAPYTISSDKDYYDEVIKVYDLLSYFAEMFKLTSAPIIGVVKDQIMHIISEYYKGNIYEAQTGIFQFIDSICDFDDEAIVTIDDCSIFKDNRTDDNIPFFRARLSDNEEFKAKDMMSIPFSKRYKTSTERFSMPGFPCLYLGNTSYVCWLEMGKPADHRFNVSPVYIDKKLRMFDLTVTLGNTFKWDENGISVDGDLFHDLIMRIMLSMCSSFRIREESRNFKSEYILPQLIMLACKKRGLDGVIYISSKVSNAELYKVCAVNLALFSKYPNNEFNSKSDATELDKYIQIDDPFNYAMYKQITGIDPIEKPLWIESNKWVKNIESNGETFSYLNTLFLDFDKYLIRRWKKKRSKRDP